MKNQFLDAVMEQRAAEQRALEEVRTPYVYTQADD